MKRNTLFALILGLILGMTTSAVAGGGFGVLWTPTAWKQVPNWTRLATNKINLLDDQIAWIFDAMDTIEDDVSDHTHDLALLHYKNAQLEDRLAALESALSVTQTAGGKTIVVVKADLQLPSSNLILGTQNPDRVTGSNNVVIGVQYEDHDVEGWGNIVTGRWNNVGERSGGNIVTGSESVVGDDSHWNLLATYTTYVGGNVNFAVGGSDNEIHGTSAFMIGSSESRVNNNGSGVIGSMSAKIATTTGDQKVVIDNTEF